MVLRLEPTDQSAGVGVFSHLPESTIAHCDEHPLLPEQLHGTCSSGLGLDGWDAEHFLLGSCATTPRLAPSDTPNTSICDLGFLTELMETAIPASTDLPDASLCDVSFITELMECDFSHQNDKQSVDLDALHGYDPVDVNHAMSNAHPHCHHQKTQLSATSHANDDGLDLDIHQTISSHLQDACSLHGRAEDCAHWQSDVHVDDDEGSHALHCGKQSHALQVGDEDFPEVGAADSRLPTSHASSPEEGRHRMRTCDITELQSEDRPQTPSCSSDDGASHDESLDMDVGEESSPTFLSEEGAIVGHQLDKEKLKCFEVSHEKTQELNLKLLHLLLACAEAVSEDNFELASVVLSRLQELSCEYGSHLQRLSFYLSDALEARIVPSSKAELQRSLQMPLSRSDMLEAFCVFYNVNPIGRFCHLTLNQLILDSTLSDTSVHLVDLHVGYGMQWAGFLYAVALRPCGPPKLRLTGIGPLEEPLISTGKKLMDMANSLQVPFEYCPIAVHLQELDVGMIRICEDEVCVISSLGRLHTLLHKGSDCMDAFLAGLKTLKPKVLVLAENDVNHNSPLFLDRFVECLKYYAAVFESLDAALPPTSQARLKMERLLCGRKIGSILACEGAERVERHETMEEWVRRLERVGFRNAEITHSAVDQAKLLLNIYYPNGYSLTEDGKALTLRWNGAALMAIGIWH